MKRSFKQDGTVIWSDNEARHHRIDGPAVIRPGGACFWYKHGKRHRIGGPAVYGKGNGERWYKDGREHRTDGPAIIFAGGKTDWFVEGECIKDYEHFQKLTGRSDAEIILLKLKWGKIEYWIVNTAAEWNERV